jgi:hypothetical protein
MPLPGLQLEVAWESGRLTVDAYYQPVSRLQKLIQRMGQGTARLFNILIYYLIYFPLIHFLEQQHGFHLLHAAAISHPGGDFLLAGLPGSGKSTFSLVMLSDPEALLLSDNLLLFKGFQVFACPEIIHLTPFSEELLPSNVKAHLSQTGRGSSYRRNEYYLAKQARCWQAQPRTLFFLGLSSKLECRRVDRPEALGRLAVFDQMAKEINAYASFVAPLELIAPWPGQFDRKQAALRELVSQLACYELWLEKGNGLEAARQSVEQVLSFVSQSVEPA